MKWQRLLHIPIHILSEHSDEIAHLMPGELFDEIISLYRGHLNCMTAWPGVYMFTWTGTIIQIEWIEENWSVFVGCTVKGMSSVTCFPGLQRFDVSHISYALWHRNYDTKLCIFKDYRESGQWLRKKTPHSETFCPSNPEEVIGLQEYVLHSLFVSCLFMTHPYYMGLFEFKQTLSWSHWTIAVKGRDFRSHSNMNCCHISLALVRR